MHGLVGHHTNGPPVHPRVAGDDRLPGLGSDVEEVAVVEDPQQDLVHVVGHVVRVRHDRVEFQIVAGDFGFQPGVDDRRFVEAVGRQKRQKVPHVLVCGGLGLHHLMDVAVARLVVGAPQLVEADVLTGDVLDDVGAGDEHVTLVAHRHHQIGLDRRIHRSPSAFAQNDGDLRHQPTEQFVAAPQLGVPGQRGDGVLDAGAAGVVDADDRAADHRAPLHQPGHLAAKHLPDGAAEHGLVVREHADRPAVDEAMSGDHAVPVERVGVTGGAAQRSDLHEATRIDQLVDAGAGTRDALLVALGGGLLTAGFLGQLQAFAQLRQLLGGGVQNRLGDGHCLPTSLVRSASICPNARLMCSPTLAMIGSSMA
ncbi:Uncharacterised protein [Mycobacterium tuberculosis]|uniref:Uncharacterized protein n=2 Tax=Mycobacterium tuberculosis TaxID=1773 RepID=A0A0T9XHA4_MYCTX|nr:Uncharacterised protein [Mycobacterium tuberculosis]CFR72667.1 Uncharacterised protein [Mycobacterium tuberculosis]CKP23036.1 Uncharacterised protein [Mycobacterium tuberculosis]CNU57834.1 Uncharacterised protein [Mycobacterium tuberculosis]CNV24315.1 Uncharacterised protein [Mycobacterium tuberculosis]